MKHLLIILSFLLLPISVYGSVSVNGFQWIVSYDVKKSDGSYERIDVIVPVGTNMKWELPNQVGNWKCNLIKFEDEFMSRVSLHCTSKENELIK